jgi:hypothetical protein
MVQLFVPQTSGLMGFQQPDLMGTKETEYENVDGANLA